MTKFVQLFFTFTCIMALTALSPAKASSITHISIKDAIHVGTYEYISRALKESVEQKHHGLLIELDTPGGYLEATRDIVQLMLASEHPIAVWVTPDGARAASAGSMLTMAAHVAIMSPSTSIGAATPVTQGGDIAEDMKKKVTNDTVSFVEGIASKRGRNIEWAKESITSAASLSSEEALKKNVIDHLAENEMEVKNILAKAWSLNADEVVFKYTELRFREKMISFFANPNIAYALMGLGALGIYMEMTNPGLIFPGAIGAISLALGAMTTKIVPINSAAIGLLILALIFFAIEIFVPAATFGIAGGAGIVSLFLSGTLLLDPSQTDLRLDPVLWVPLFLVAVTTIIWFMVLSIRAVKAEPYKQGVGALVGRNAVVTRVANLERKQYKVMIDGELWNATAEEPLNETDAVVITKQDGFLLTIKKE
jgi:membrane-bound serine protease (ClpP class)